MTDSKPHFLQLPLLHWALFHPTAFCRSALAVTLGFAFGGLTKLVPSGLLSVFTPFCCIAILVGVVHIFINSAGCTCRQRYQNRLYARFSKVSLISGLLFLYMPISMIVAVSYIYGDYPFIGLCCAWPYLLFLILHPDGKYDAEIQLANSRTLNRHHLSDMSLSQLQSLLVIAHGLRQQSNAMVIERQMERLSGPEHSEAEQSI